MIGTTYHDYFRNKIFRLPIRTIFRTKRFSERAACGPPWARLLYLLYLYRPIDQKNKKKKNNKKTKMSFKSTQIFFRERLGTPLDKKSVTSRIYTLFASFVANQFFSSFFGFSFLVKIPIVQGNLVNSNFYTREL